MLHTKYQCSRPCSFRQEDFFMFSLYISPCKHVTRGQALFSPQRHNLDQLYGGPLGDATYQISRLSDYVTGELNSHPVTVK